MGAHSGGTPPWTVEPGTLTTSPCYPWGRVSPFNSWHSQKAGSGGTPPGRPEGHPRTQASHTPLAWPCPALCAPKGPAVHSLKAQLRGCAAQGDNPLHPADLSSLFAQLTLPCPSPRGQPPGEEPGGWHGCGGRAWAGSLGSLGDAEQCLGKGAQEEEGPGACRKLWAPRLDPSDRRSRQPGGFQAPCSRNCGSSIPYSKSQAPALPRADTPTLQRGVGTRGKKWGRAGQLGTHLWAVGCWGPRGPRQWMLGG